MVHRMGATLLRGFGGPNMRKLRCAVVQFLRDDAGATAIEYGLIAALIATAAITGMTLFGGSMQGLFNYVSGRSASAMSGG